MTRITKNTVFDSPLLRRLIQGGINLFLPQPRDERTPVSRALLIHLLSQRIRPTETLALNAAFALAFAVFLRMGEFTYPAAALVDRNRFRMEHLTVSRISLGPDHIVVVLPRSKTCNHASYG